jgi:hypothetical protein
VFVRKQFWAWPDPNWESFKLALRPALRPAGEPSLRVSPLDAGQNPARKCLPDLFPRGPVTVADGNVYDMPKCALEQTAETTAKGAPFREAGQVVRGPISLSCPGWASKTDKLMQNLKQTDETPYYNLLQNQKISKPYSNLSKPYSNLLKPYDRSNKTRFQR